MRRIIVLVVLVSITLAGCTASPKSSARKKDALGGTAWKLESWVAEAQDPAPLELALEFGPDRTVKIFSAVNTFDATYDYGIGQTFAINDLPETTYPGSDAVLNQAEGIYLRFLDQTRSYRLEGGKLIFEDKVQADLMTFSPIE